eukprot:jgi/Botrbrau1/20400/Bobra.0006s0060.1
MGVAGNMPLALAPGMGLNAYFTYNVVGYRGTGKVHYRTSARCDFCGGHHFQHHLVHWSARLSGGAGPQEPGAGVLGGYRHVPGLHRLSMVGGHWPHHLQLGHACHSGWLFSTVLGTAVHCHKPVSRLCGASGRARAEEGRPRCLGRPFPGTSLRNHACAEGSRLKAPTLWLAVMGFVIICMLMSVNFRGALLVGILFVTIIAWIPGHSASYLGAESLYPGGIGNNGAGRTAFFKSVVAFPTLSKTGLALDFAGLKTGEAWSALITFLYVDFLETTGFLLSMAEYLSRFIPGYMDPKTKTWPRSLWAYLSDGTAISIGALMGTSPPHCLC